MLLLHTGHHGGDKLKKNSFKAVAAACCLSVSGFSYAESTDVVVTGIINPAACTPTLGAGGTVDYGYIHPSTLNKDAFTVLGEKQVDFSITCDSPAKVAIVAKSGRGASAVANDGSLSEVVGGMLLFGATNVSAFGLGLADSKGIGGYGIRVQSGTVLADGNAVDSIQSAQSAGSTSSWEKTDYGVLVAASSLRYSSWAAKGNLEPVAFTTLAGKLGVQAYINKASELDLTRPITLDGLATLEIVYL